MAKLHSDEVAESVVEGRYTIAKLAKSYIFDLVAIVLVVALIIINLGVIEQREITLETIGDIFLSFAPFYLLAILLNLDYYTKGVFAGKATQGYGLTQDNYSGLVNRLTGRQIDKFPEFCDYFNEQVLNNKRATILKEGALRLDQFNDEWIDKNGEVQPPLKTMTKADLCSKVGEVGANAVLAAKKCKIRGIKVNVLLGTGTTDDPSDVGLNEEQLRNSKMAAVATGYLFSIALLSLIVIKDIQEWGWSSIFLVIFKAAYVFCRAYTAYFDGYNDITIKVSNYINRKADIIKQYNSWYADKYSKIEDDENNKSST